MASISFRARSSDVFGLGVGFDAGAYDEGIECRHIRLGWRSGSPTVGPTERAKMATEEELRHVVFRCDPWLASFPLTEATAIEYFSLSPFYEKDCLNETLRARGIRPDEVEAMKSMVGTEYVVLASRPPHLFAIAKRRRMNPERTKLIAMYYLLDGNVYQAPTLLELITSRTERAMFNLREAFDILQEELYMDRKHGNIDEISAPGIPMEEPRSEHELEERAKMQHALTMVLRNHPVEHVTTNGGGLFPGDSKALMADRGEEGRHAT